MLSFTVAQVKCVCFIILSPKLKKGCNLRFKSMLSHYDDISIEPEHPPAIRWAGDHPSLPLMRRIFT